MPEPLLQPTPGDNQGAEARGDGLDADVARVAHVSVGKDAASGGDGHGVERLYLHAPRRLLRFELGEKL